MRFVTDKCHDHTVRSVSRHCVSWQYAKEDSPVEVEKEHDQVEAKLDERLLFIKGRRVSAACTGVIETQAGLAGIGDKDAVPSCAHSAS